MAIESIKVPDLGGADSVEVIEICVAVGDEVAKDDSLIVLESDKASMEVPSPKAGKVVAIKVSDGDTLTAGSVILDLDISGEGSADSAPASSETKAPAAQQEVASAKPAQAEQQAPAVSDSGAARTAVVAVPDLGGADEVDVIEVCVSPGDSVAEGDSLIVLESDKASMEVPAPFAGKVIAVTLKEGDKAKAGVEILQMETSAAAGSKAPAPAAKPAAETKTAAASAAKSSPAMPAPVVAASEPATQAAESKAGRKSGIYAGPAVRKLAREMGVNLDKVKATGPRSRISKDDVKAFVKQALTEKPAVVSGSGIPQVPEVDFAKFGEIRIEPMSKIHKVTSDSMHRSWLNVPHVTQFDDADITDLEDFRQSMKDEAEKRGTKLTPIPFLLKACAAALIANPKFNVSLHSDGQSIVYKQYVHIGMAVDTPAGLVVPVIRDVDKKSVWELAEEVAVVAQKAKERKLTPNDMQGGCFTISSLGNIGGQGFTPIVNTPEVAILGVSKLTVKPVWDGSNFVPRKMLPLSLSYDHRAINGADAGRFFTFLNDVLADIRRLVL